MEPKLRKIKKTGEIENKNHQKSMFSYSFANLTQVELNISALNYQNAVKGVLTDILTSLASLGAHP